MGCIGIVRSAVPKPLHFQPRNLQNLSSGFSINLFTPKLGVRMRGLRHPTSLTPRSSARMKTMWGEGLAEVEPSHRSRIGIFICRSFCKLSCAWRFPCLSLRVFLIKTHVNSDILTSFWQRKGGKGDMCKNYFRVIFVDSVFVGEV